MTDDPVVERVRELIGEHRRALRAQRSSRWPADAPAAQYTKELERIERDAREMTKLQLRREFDTQGMEAWSKFRNAETLDRRRTATLAAQGAAVVEGGPSRSDRRWAKTAAGRGGYPDRVTLGEAADRSPSGRRRNA